jgi:hypothetical protein
MGSCSDVEAANPRRHLFRRRGSKPADVALMSAVLFG